MSKIKLMDCTLRDGGNVVGKGFPADITDMVLDGLTACHVPFIEFGNSGGIGAYEVAGFTDALTDTEYLQIAQKYLNRGSDIGMFLNAKRYREKNVDLAAENGMAFLRVGADAGDGAIAMTAIKDIKKRNMKAFYSAMKAYLLPPAQLAEEAKSWRLPALTNIPSWIPPAPCSQTRLPLIQKPWLMPYPSPWPSTATTPGDCLPPMLWPHGRTERQSWTAALWEWQEAPEIWPQRSALP